MPLQTPVEQVGGTHYVPATKYGHWDLVDEHSVQYLEACASKYVGRWESKGGVQDLEKAISYIDKRLASLKLTAIPTGADITGGCSSGGFSHYGYRRFNVSTLKLLKWFDNADLSQLERVICTYILCWERYDDLVEAKKLIRELISTHPQGYVNQG